MVSAGEPRDLTEPGAYIIDMLSIQDTYPQVPTKLVTSDSIALCGFNHTHVFFPFSHLLRNPYEAQNARLCRSGRILCPSTHCFYLTFETPSEQHVQADPSLVFSTVARVQRVCGAVPHSVRGPLTTMLLCRLRCSAEPTPCSPVKTLRLTILI